MFSVGNINIKNALLLAPMEDVTDLSFRLICKELGADVVYTEFVNSEGLIRGSEKTHKKLEISDLERPVGIQIYGNNIKSMIEAAKIAESHNPDLIDINAGCWVKNVVKCGAGAGLLKDPAYLEQLVKEIVKSVQRPVTVKTRLGWDASSIQIIDVAKRLEDAGCKAITIHCRTRADGLKGNVEWEWISKIKSVVNIPIVLNGNIFNGNDVNKAFKETGADGVMIARGAIGNPWIFHEAKMILAFNNDNLEIDEKTKIAISLKHLRLAINVKGERRAVLEHRKFYSGYLKGLPNASSVRMKLMSFYEYAPVENLLLSYSEELQSNKNTRTDTKK